MPYLCVRTSAEISAEQERILKAKLGKAIEQIPGKTEQWLMVEFADNCRLWFGGKNDVPCAVIQVDLFGRASDEACSRMTAALSEIFSEELGISPKNLYVKYKDYDQWGWNGSNF
ncbi:MAG: phenylpyruvate tautomerase MIF-related protein [Candidatus Merdivicinus sp.]|jgi:phenylpyruvate tautomerase PptA (4-oxalocrotonate tautomerase family)